MRFVDVIEKKADGFQLTNEEIEKMVLGFTEGRIPDYQMSSMMTAILQQGMTPEETAELTMA
ncbi:MAG: pyrimidine-nucleoside phosphorylase, partial [Erysipelotrichia bacterium]|nr:pyrimidine-nucleoside phosphorylase [Erysipelotrichia bacterium]